MPCFPDTGLLAAFMLVSGNSKMLSWLFASASLWRERRGMSSKSKQYTYFKVSTSDRPKKGVTPPSPHFSSNFNFVTSYFSSHPPRIPERTIS